MIAITPDHWQGFGAMPLSDVAILLQELAAQVNLKRFLKQPRKLKTKSPPRLKDPKQPQVSTAKLLAVN